MRGAVILCALLAGCAAVPPGDAPSRGDPARPEAVTLYRDTVTARFSDGQLCTAVRPAGTGPGGWRAPLAGCPHIWAAEVTTPAAPRQPRLPLREGAGSRVLLTAPSGAAFAYGTDRPEA